MSKRANSNSLRLGFQKNWENNELIYNDNFSEQFINDLFIRNLIKNILIKNKIIISKIFISQNYNSININLELFLEPKKLIKFFCFFANKNIKMNFFLNNFLLKKNYLKKNFILQKLYKIKLKKINNFLINNINYNKLNTINYFIKKNNNYKKNIKLKNNNNYYSLKKIYYKWKYLYKNNNIIIKLNNYKLYKTIKLFSSFQKIIKTRNFWKSLKKTIKKYNIKYLENKLKKKYFYHIIINYFKNILKYYIIKQFKKQRNFLLNNININIINIYNKLENSKLLKVKLKKNFIKFLKIFKNKIKLKKNRKENKKILKYIFRIISFSLIFKNPELINNLLVHFLSKSKQNQKKILLIFTELFKFFKICNFNNLEGIKFTVKGRINSSARTQKFQFITGKIPLETFKNKIFYSQNMSKTKFGSLGINLWLHYI